MLHRQQSLPDIAPSSCVYKRNAPVWRRLTEDLHLLAEIRDNAVVVCGLLVVEEIILDDRRLLPEAKNEISMAVATEVLLDMPQARLLADRTHPLSDAHTTY